MADIVGRIKKLLQRAQHANANPEEAAAAAALAQELMFKYQIGESDINLDGDEKRAEEPIIEDTVHEEKKNKVDTWKSSLLHTVARAFGCRMWTWRDGTTKYKVLGTTSATQTVNYMFGYLQSDIDRLAKEAWAEAKGTTNDSPRTFINSFRMGAVDTVRRRLRLQTAQQEAILKKREEAEKEKAAEQRSVALALYRGDQERVEEAYTAAAKRLRLRTRRTSYSTNYNAYQRGQEAGRSLSLGGGKALGADKRRIDD